MGAMGSPGDPGIAGGAVSNDSPLVLMMYVLALESLLNTKTSSFVQTI